MTRLFPPEVSKVHHPSVIQETGICKEFVIGDLVWSKVGTYPWWPCMVSSDPQMKVHTRINTRGKTHQATPMHTVSPREPQLFSLSAAAQVTGSITFSSSAASPRERGSTRKGSWCTRANSSSTSFRRRLCAKQQTQSRGKKYGHLIQYLHSESKIIHRHRKLGFSMSISDSRTLRRTWKESHGHPSCFTLYF